MKTHAQNKMTQLAPKCYQTYCGKTTSKVTLAKSNEEPTCAICKRHYDDPAKAKLKAIILNLTAILDDFFSVQLWILDADGKLERFIGVVEEFFKDEVAKQLKNDKDGLIDLSREGLV